MSNSTPSSAGVPRPPSKTSPDAGEESSCEPVGLDREECAPVLHLEYGSHHGDVDCQGFRVCEEGMCFKSRWEFPVGTELGVEFLVEDPYDPEAIPRTVETEGIVADSTLITETCGCYLITLLFVDADPECLRELRDVSKRLRARIG